MLSKITAPLFLTFSEKKRNFSSKNIKSLLKLSYIFTFPANYTFSLFYLTIHIYFSYISYHFFKFYFSDNILLTFIYLEIKSFLRASSIVSVKPSNMGMAEVCVVDATLKVKYILKNTRNLSPENSRQVRY